MTDPPRVDLVALTRDHLSPIRMFLQDRTLRTLIGTTAAPSEAEHERWYRRATSDPARLVRVIVDCSGNAIGAGGLNNIDLINSDAELWIYVAVGRRASAGRQAARMLLQIAFEDLGLHRVGVRVFGFNDVAHRFFHGLGFRDEGTDREAVRAFGRFHDVWRMAILVQDFTPST